MSQTPFIGKQVRVTDRGEDVGLAELFDALGWVDRIEDMIDVRDAEAAMAEVTELGATSWEEILEEPPICPGRVVE